VITRVAASHLRVGTFQYFASKGDLDGLQILAEYAIARHYPEAALSAQPIRALLDGVVARQARLVAQWMLFGFIHGVMNTDNTSISGETIDYGPCAFMEAYNPAMVFSSIDQRGRYAYSNQPHAMHWNLARLAEALLPLLEREAGKEEAALEAARQSLGAFGPQFESARHAGLRRKLGLFTERAGDAVLAEDLLQRMAANQADFTLTFRRLADAATGPEGDAGVRAHFADPKDFDVWAMEWRKRLNEESVSRQESADLMRSVSPKFIPRNHLVEAAIVAATEQEDFQPFKQLLSVVTNPFSEQPESERYTAPARPEERILQTFCGT
jgi:uncharacterized protein YdiU (UPF0061 family)